MEMDGADTQLCDLIQNEFPVVERPYAALGEALGLTEGDVIARVARLRGERIIRQISAIFDTRKLGYTSMLVAAKTAPERADEAAEVIGCSEAAARRSLHEALTKLRKDETP